MMSLVHEIAAQQVWFETDLAEFAIEFLKTQGVDTDRLLSDIEYDSLSDSVDENDLWYALRDHIIAAGQEDDFALFLMDAAK